MNCLPGMPCYDDNIPPIIPDLVETSSFIGYPIISSFIYYSGTYLPNTGINTNDFLTVALQKIDPQISPISIAEKILDRMVNNPAYNAQICAIVDECTGGTTTTTTSTSTSTTSTSTSTTTTTTTIPPTTTTTTTTIVCDCHTITNYSAGALNVNYTNCAGTSVVQSVPASTIVSICNRTGTSITGDVGIGVYSCSTNCTTEANCTSCAPVTTTTTTTVAPTTTTTTSSTSTTTSTSTSTTSTTTSTSTSTTTTTTTATPTTTTTTTLAPFSGVVSVGDDVAAACNAPLFTTPVTGNAPTFCASTVLVDSGLYFAGMSGTLYIAYGGQVIQATFNLTNTATTVGSCSLCPGATTTTTSTSTTSTSTTTTSSTSTTTTTTTNVPPPLAINLARNVTSSALACTDAATPANLVTFYTNTTKANLEAAATYIPPVSDLNYYLYSEYYYSEGFLTTMPASNGYYSDGVYWYQVDGSFGLGKVSAAGVCTPFTGTGVLLGDSAAGVCYNPFATISITGNGLTFCGSTKFTSTYFNPGFPGGTYYLKYLTDVKAIVQQGTFALSPAPCEVCPTTTTTTTADPYDYYNAQVYSCATCSAVDPIEITKVKVLRPFTADYAKYYKSLSQTSSFYDLTEVTTGPASIVIQSTQYTTCNAVCGITTTTTTSSTSTTTSTTSTTTTLPPVTLSTTPGCTGGAGTGTVLANGFSGGTGSFQYIAISSTSPTDALTKLDNSATRTLIDGATEYTFTSLVNATYYVAIMDFSGNKGASTGAIVNCITTTTTTTLPPYKYYTVDRRATCTTGIENPVAMNIRLPYSFTPTLNGWYRDASGACTYSYRLSNITPVTPGASPVPVDATTYTTSTLACGPNCLNVDFSGSTSCANVGVSDGSVTITSFTGGSGVFDATPANTTYATEAAALAGTFDNVTTTRTYSSLAAGTYWVAIRDRGNVANKIAKSFTVAACPPSVSLGSAYCADIACLSPTGNAVVPCGGGYNVNVANAPSGYTVTMTYSVQGGPDGSYANLQNPSTGVYKVQAWFAAAGSNIVITLSLRNSSNVEVAQSVSIVSRNSPSNFLGLPNCSPNSNVVLSPQNSLDGDSYTVYINGVADAAWNTGTRSYTAYTTIKIVYASPSCGVLLNGSAYTSNSTITLLNGTTYTFTLYNANHYVDTGSAYCEGCQRRQGTINDCGATSYRVLADNSCDCGVGCGGTYYDPQECSGSALIRKQRYVCNNALTGVIDTIDACSCSCNISCDGTYFDPPYCNINGNGEVLKNEKYSCNGAFIQTVLVDECSCSCNLGCDGTTEITYCVGGGDTTLYGRLVYNCDPNVYASSQYVIEYNSITCGYQGTFDVYQSCSTFQLYYINFVSSNPSRGEINGECCDRVATQFTQEDVTNTYPSALGPNYTISNPTCPCE